MKYYIEFNCELCGKALKDDYDKNTIMYQVEYEFVPIKVCNKCFTQHNKLKRGLNNENN